MKESLIVIHAKGEQKISEVIGKLKKNNAREVFVFFDKELKGILSHFLLLNSRQNVNDEKIKQYIMPVSKVDINDDLIEITQKFIDSNSIVLPVFENNNLVKFIDIYELFNLLKDEPKLKINIDNIIQELLTIQDNTTLGEVLHFMHYNKVKEIYVEDKEQIIGIITSIDILKKYTLKHTAERQHGEIPNTPTKTHQTEIIDLKKLSVKNFVEPIIKEIKQDAKLNEVIEFLSKTMTHNIIIKNSDNKHIGMISIEEILKNIIEIFQTEVKNIFYQGLNELNLDDKMFKNIQDTVTNYTEKLKHNLKNNFKINIHIKEYQKEGNKSRFQVFSKLTSPGAVLSSEDDDWDIITAIRKSFEKLKHQVEKK